MSHQFRNLIIDGYNLIHHIPSLARYLNSDLQRARELLLIKLANYAYLKQALIKVVFDGQKMGQHSQPAQPGVEVIFTQGRKADQQIKDLASRITSKKDWLIITSDFDIRYFVEGLMISTRSSEDFAAELASLENRTLKKSAARQNRTASEWAEKKPTSDDMAWAYEVFLKNKR
ncbi:MAG: NYN domain-containing protein [Candidatus Saccharicenans sp.]